MDSSLSLLLISLIGVAAFVFGFPWRDGNAKTRSQSWLTSCFALTAAFFAASIGLVYLFERLRENK